MITNINVKKLFPHHKNPRQDLGDLTELTESIKANGVLQNLTVVPWVSSITGKPGDNGSTEGEYTVVVGHRRLAAAKLAGLEEVPCMITDMDMKTQVATMLAENMQRNDLTIWEQAHGLQMMLDLGESVGEVSKLTGLSDSTIRRRVQLMDLDQDNFRKAVDNGATFMDLAELHKITDAEARNNVLKHFGTSNYKYELDRAIQKEQMAETEALYCADLEKFATRLADDEDAFQSRKYVKCFSTQSTYTKVTPPEDAGTVKYFFKVSRWSVDLYKERDMSEVDTAADEVRRIRDERCAAISEVTDRAHKLRMVFIKDFTGAKEYLGVIIPHAITMIRENMYGFGNEEYKQLTGAVKCSPETALLYAVCCKFEANGTSCSTWSGEYQRNKTLESYYKLLGLLGYQASDDEKAMMDGTHECYAKGDEQ